MASMAAGATEPDTSSQSIEEQESGASNDDRRVLSGNEAIARGAWEAGVVVGAGYPGTPSTEILESLVRLPDVNCEWAPNEKVALEVAVGAALAGGRALATMKHVGLNVAADPLFSAAYMGVNAGLVVVTADDPGMHSSQNEQDNRLFARAARLPLLEPATPEEARRFTAAAFALSERHDTPVLLRSTTALSHCRSRVRLAGRSETPRRPYNKDRVKNVVLPAHGRIRHKLLEDRRMPALAAEADAWTEVVDGPGDLAIITAGPVYLYVREAFPDSPVLKLGMSHPLPAGAVKRFAAQHPRILVVEELDPFIEEQVRALGIACEPRKTPRYGELSVEALRAAYGRPTTDGRRSTVEADAAEQATSHEHGSPDEPAAVDGQRPPVAAPQAPPLPTRPPALCPGCSHRGTFYVLNQKDAIVSGDIGCYTLGALPPLDAMDSCLNMGASISMAHGMGKVMPEEERNRLVAVIGDSTFYHSGITGLIDVVYNGGASTVVVLDNHTTAMTGHQEHPGTGRTLMGEPAQVVDIEMLAKSVGVKDVRHVDPYDLGAAWRTIDDAMRRDEPSLLIADAPCVLRERITFGDSVAIDTDKCTNCYGCTRVGCSAIEQTEDHLEVNSILCIGCTHCQQVCSDCNAGIDVPQVLELVGQGRYREAFDVLVRANPFPSIAGRVCPHPCDHEVNALGWPQRRLRAQQHPDLVPGFPDPHHEGAISVREVEKFLGDWAIENVDGA
ncbi:MAG TPA: thiamine pyrophosphate-dependent enzyme, partial [Longimicrobiales bacterium]|nr:thiamine pyrophosphate-dependent enzyme [Longimicrobiales bacterium]